MEQVEGVYALFTKSASLQPTLPSHQLALLQLVLAVMEQLEGAYALLIKSTHYPGELVACKRGSPLILGLRAAPKAAGVASPGVCSQLSRQCHPRTLCGTGLRGIA